MKTVTIFSKLNAVPWIISRSHFRTGKYISCCNYCHTEKNHVDLLVELTGCSIQKAEDAVRNRKQFAISDENKIRKAHKVLQELGLSNSDMSRCLRILSVHPSSLLNHFMILEEAGFSREKIDPFSLTNFYSLLHLSVRQLKNRGFIDHKTSVLANYSKLVGLPEIRELKSLSGKVDEVYLFDIHVDVLKLFITWKFEGVWPENQVINDRLRYKSIRLISKSYDLLTKEFGLTKEKVRNLFPLLCILPERLEEILIKVPYLADTDVREVVKLWPKMLVNTAEALVAIDNSLKEFGVKKEAVLATPSIYTLRPENVRNRLNLVKEHPILSQWLYHPKFLDILVSHNKVLHRLEVLQKANMQCVSLHLLKTSNERFMRHVEYLDKSNQQDVLTYLHLTLSIDKKKS